MNSDMRDAVGALGFIAIFSAFFVMGRSFPDIARTYPSIVCILGVFFCAILLGRSVIKIKNRDVNVENKIRFSRKHAVNVVVTVAATVFYVVLTGTVGYYVMTFAFVSGFAYYLDSSQKKYIYILVALLMDVLLYWGFEVFLNVNLPHGLIF